MHAIHNLLQYNYVIPHNVIDLTFHFQLDSFILIHSGPKRCTDACSFGRYNFKILILPEAIWQTYECQTEGCKAISLELRHSYYFFNPTWNVNCKMSFQLILKWPHAVFKCSWEVCIYELIIMIWCAFKWFCRRKISAVANLLFPLSTTAHFSYTSLLFHNPARRVVLYCQHSQLINNLWLMPLCFLYSSLYDTESPPQKIHLEIMIIPTWLECNNL